MEEFLTDFYSEEDITNLYLAFKLRNTVQYYVNNIIDQKEIDNLIINTPEFFAKSKQILSALNEDKINKIRSKFKDLIKDKNSFDKNI